MRKKERKRKRKGKGKKKKKLISDIIKSKKVKKWGEKKRKNYNPKGMEREERAKMQQS